MGAIILSSRETRARQEAFLDRLLSLGSTVAPGKRGVSMTALVELVREDPEAAVVVAQGLARMATEDATMGQRAIALGAAYEAAFDDDLVSQEVSSILTASGTAVPELHTIDDEGTGDRPTEEQAPNIWLEVSPDMLQHGDIYPIVSTFGVHSGPENHDLAAAASSCGRTFLTFPIPTADPRPVWTVPEVRSYIQSVNRAVPYLPIFFTPDPEHAMFQVWFGALADPEALEGHTVRLDHASVISTVAYALTTVRLTAELLGLDIDEACRNVMAGTPPDWQDFVLDLVASLPDADKR
jgi:hypothetical protein